MGAKVSVTKTSTVNLETQMRAEARKSAKSESVTTSDTTAVNSEEYSTATSSKAVYKKSEQAATKSKSSTIISKHNETSSASTNLTKEVAVSKTKSSSRVRNSANISSTSIVQSSSPLPPERSPTSPTQLGNRAPGEGLLRTTMVVRFRPGQATQQGTWVAEMQPGDSASSICGLEISFSSVPQDIDIKVIPGNQQEDGESSTVNLAESKR